MGHGGASKAGIVSTCNLPRISQVSRSILFDLEYLANRFNDPPGSNMLIVDFDAADLGLSTRKTGTFGQVGLGDVGRSSRLADRPAV